MSTLEYSFYAFSRICRSGGLATVAACLAGVVLYNVIPQSSQPYWAILGAGFAAATMRACTKHLSDIAKGTGATLWGLFLEYNVEPTVLLVVGLLLPKGSTAIIAILCVVVSHAVALCAAWLWIRRHFPCTKPKAHGLDPLVRHRIYMENLANAATWTVPAVLVGFFFDKEESGLFGISQRIAGVGTVIVVALASQYSRQFAALSFKHEYVALRHSLRKAQIVSLVLFLPVWAMCFFFPEQLLKFLGQDFTQASNMVRLLTTVQLATTFFGVSTDFLKMTGSERLGMVVAWAAAAMSLLGAVVTGVIGDLWLFTLAFSLANLMRRIVCWLVIQVQVKA